MKLITTKYLENRQIPKYYHVEVILFFFKSFFKVFLCPFQALTRFNEQLTKNCHLREELQTLHIERVRFQQLHNRLDKVRGRAV